MVVTLERLAPPIEPTAERRPGTVPGVLPRKPARVMPSEAAALVAQAIAAGTGDPRRAAERLLAAADRDQDRLERAASLLIQRLKLCSNDCEATLALRIAVPSLAAAPYPDGPWRWDQRLSPRRIRATRRRAARRRFWEGRNPTRRTPAEVHPGTPLDQEGM